MTLLFNDIKTYDIVCLDHYPFQPFMVMHCHPDGRMTMSSYGDGLRTQRRFLKQQFEDAGYIRWDKEKANG